MSAPSASVAVNAPNVTFTLAEGFALSLEALKGKVVAVVACRSIEAAGCKRESQGLAQHWPELGEHHVTAIGVVPENDAQYREAIARRELPFEFAADVDGRAMRALGVNARDADPTVFLVNRDGTIRAVWKSADPDAHVRELLIAAE